MSENLKDWVKFTANQGDDTCLICGGEMFGMGHVDGSWEDAERVFCNTGCAFNACVEADEDGPLIMVISDEWDSIISLIKERDALQAKLVKALDDKSELERIRTNLYHSVQDFEEDLKQERAAHAETKKQLDELTNERDVLKSKLQSIPELLKSLAWDDGIIDDDWEDVARKLMELLNKEA